MILLDENKNPLKEITLRRGESPDGEYNYWELTKNLYNTSGKLIYSEEPSLKNIPLSLAFEDSLLEGYLEKHYYNSSNSDCKSFYQYDSLGKISIIKNYNIDGDSILNYFLYDKNNRIVLNKIVKNGLLFREIKHSYEGGYYFKKIFSYEYENGKQRKIDEKAIFKIKYDNNKIAYQSYSLDGEVLHETIYKYNADGNLSECHQYEENRILKRIMRYKY